MSRLRRLSRRCRSVDRPRVRSLERALAAGEIDRNSFYDDLTVMILRRYVPRDAFCVDAGCHAGSILKMMMEVAPEGRFLAVEPLPNFIALLEESFGDDPRVTVVQLALSTSAGVSSFNHVISNPAYSGLIKRWYPTEEVEETITVQTARLDDVLSKHGWDRIDVLKIDVEGAERLVIEGGIESIRKSRPLILVEHGRGASELYGTTPEAFHDLVRSVDLNLYLLPAFLDGGPPLRRQELRTIFDRGSDYFFLAHRH